MKKQQQNYSKSFQGHPQPSASVPPFTTSQSAAAALAAAASIANSVGSTTFPFVKNEDLPRPKAGGIGVAGTTPTSGSI
jgi:hypothetical protein